MPRKPHTHHYIYKTTCIITKRYYIGMHSTSKLEDNYIGSGTRLWKSIKKHGRESHIKEIIEYLPNRELLKAREKELITEELLKDPNCMNIQKGGDGGFCSDAHSLKCSTAGGKSFSEKMKNDPEYRAKFCEKVRQNNFARKGKGLFKNAHTKGTCWITLDGKNKQIKLEKFEEFESLGWKKGKTIKIGAKWNPWNKK